MQAERGLALKRKNRIRGLILSMKGNLAMPVIEPIPDSSLKALGGALTELLDDDQWNNIENRYLLPALAEFCCMKDALLRLACLGNGDHYGNSEGNVIAIRALGLNPAEVHNQKPE